MSLSHLDDFEKRMPTYEQFGEHAGIRQISYGYVLNTFKSAYAGASWYTLA